MKKSVAVVAGIVVIGGGLWLGGAWYTGTRLEAGASEQVARINAELGETVRGVGITVQQLSFERGLFDSQARYAVKLDGEGETVTLEFDTRYEHGPFPISTLSRAQFAPTMALVRSELVRTEDVEPWFQGVQNATTPMWAEASIAYDGKVDIKSGLAAIKLDQQGDQVDFAGATLQAVYDDANPSLKGVFEAPGLSIHSTLSDKREPFHVAVTGTRLDMDVKEGRFGTQMGQAELRIARLLLEKPAENGTFSIDNLTYSVTSDEDDRNVKAEVRLRGEALTLNGFALGKPSLTFKADRFDGHAIKRIGDALRALATPSDDGGSANLAALDDAFVQDVHTLLASNPEFALEPMTWQNGKGESTLTVRTAFTDPGDIHVPSVMLLARVLKSVNLDLKLHKPMVIDLGSTLIQFGQGMDAEAATALATMQYDTLAANLVQSGFVKEDGDTLVSTLQYNGQKITVNGRDMSLRELMGLMMAF